MIWILIELALDKVVKMMIKVVVVQVGYPLPAALDRHDAQPLTGRVWRSFTRTFMTLAGRGISHHGYITESI